MPTYRLFEQYVRTFCAFSCGSSCPAEVHFLMVLKVRLAKIVVAVIAMPT
jgi:hypothetical protein